MLDHKLSDLFDIPLRIIEHNEYRQVLPDWKVWIARSDQLNRDFASYGKWE